VCEVPSSDNGLAACTSRNSCAFCSIAVAANKCITSAYAPTALRRLWGAGKQAMIDLAVILWLVSALPVAMLIGHCTLGEER
jgi:hypothetical protein